ncbi:HU domain-containing protein [Marixanthomonas spongiae]|uniref:SPOR domain-containing protein n=1 Tax=Marixanthomonas spongiae TaxID=2174845 RepID=A0A2U0I302_9FLAO|nr:SPOR domain-containing protein [Marixanthomonas spongiae]PVW15370.1 SPOR domain-containing protein [Marixanthomonas spongiae]
MQLATYIKDLLYRYECVIVPGFGAFLTQYRSARIDEETNTFYPPGKSLSFNRQLQTNDGLLANYVASVEQCSYETAVQKIRNFTAKMSLQLTEGETVLLKNLGEFALNTENALQFIPSETENFSTASFGLSAYISTEINRKTDKETVSALKKEEKTPIHSIPERHTARPYLKYAAIGLIALTVAGFGGMKLYENQVQQHNFAAKQEADNRIENQIQEATFVIENPLPAIKVTVPKQTGKYHIVAGAFRLEENAKKKIKQLSEKGYTAKLIGANRYGLHQVVYNSFEDRREALRELRTIKRTENKAAWLLVKDLAK